jgi:signal transduction histidine kinase
MIGDFIYPYYELDETYYTGHPVDITWILGYLFFIFAVITFDGRKVNTLSNISQYTEFFKFENIHKIIVPLILGAIFAVTLTTIYQTQALAESNTNDQFSTYWLVAIMITFTSIILAINHNLSKIVKTRTSELTKQTQKLEHEIREKNTLIVLQKNLEKEIADHNKELAQKSQQLQEQNKTLTEQSEELELQRQQLKEQNDKLIEVDKQKAEFASMVTHELKTPLTPIMSWCEILLEHNVLGQLNEGQKNAVLKIRHNATKELALISDILDAEKLGLNQMKFNFKDLEILPFVKELSENYAPVFAEKQIFHTVICPKDSTIHVDESRLAQVIKNFINNSMDFIPKQGGKISLEIKQEGNFAVFSVIDNGVGIPKEKQQNLFKKFYQIDTSPTRKHGGSGLGLAICKGIIESFGGTIGVQSEPGIGSTFYFKIPLKSHAVVAT